MSPLALSLRLLQAQPDERLLALASTGHEPAFEALVRRYRRPLLAYCRRLTRPDTSAEDILQQALLQAWRALGAGVEVRDARAWLYRIVHNAAISSVRGIGEPPGELGSAIRAVGVEQLVEQRMAAREVLAGLAALPALQREVMVETALEGRSHEEVATALGLSNGSVRGLIYRARATLRAAAAALIPSPLLDWAARQDLAPGAGAAAMAGGGSAGVAGAVFKGGAIVTVAGAIAGTAVVAVHPFHRHAPAAHAAGHRTIAKPSVIAAATWNGSEEPPRAAAGRATASGPTAGDLTRHGGSVVFADRDTGGRSGLGSSEGRRSTRSDFSRHERGDSGRGGGTQRRQGTGTGFSGTGQSGGFFSGQGSQSASAAEDNGGRGLDGGAGGNGTSGGNPSSSGSTQTGPGTQTSVTSGATIGTQSGVGTQSRGGLDTVTTPPGGE
jgi:RNA polymerase sigma factor (sigma-70 family)